MAGNTKNILKMIQTKEEMFLAEKGINAQATIEGDYTAIYKLKDLLKEYAEQLRKHDVVGRSSSNDKLVEIAVPENSLILTVNATKHHNRKLFKEWIKEFFDDDVNFA